MSDRQINARLWRAETMVFRASAFLAQGRPDDARQCRIRAESLLAQAARGRLAQALRLFPSRPGKTLRSNLRARITVPRDAGVLASA